MLQIQNIRKKFVTGDLTQVALDGVSLNLRDNEFVAILGPSGSGKTTLLNIIGGLDRYDSGDLIINNVSTRKYKDRDWDSYRNHTIGFVFQSYNLIPHQTILANVELALTIAGVSRRERRERATAALERVGLGDQLHKKPNQMSGGQMQRVAIARALINDPDILLADEPTGALDTDTSVQVMELLKEVAKDRLVVMVTHNPELAEQYATRIVRLRDGRITDDTDPFTPAPLDAPPEHKNLGHASMGFFTALSLSLNNLMTKKARTLLTAFAGSIGIIGIALILSLSTGINDYIEQVQQDTLSSYPITIEAESLDMSSMMTSFMGVRQAQDNAAPHEDGRVYSSTVMYDMINAMMNAEAEENDLKSFKTYLDNGGGGITDLATVRYGYDFAFDIYTRDEGGNVVKSDAVTLLQQAMSAMYGGDYSSYFDTFGSMYSRVDVWEELLPGENGELIAEQVMDQYDLLSGTWPQAYDEVVLFVNANNEISDLMLYALGYISADDMTDAMNAMMNGEEVASKAMSWSYDELCDMTFKLLLPTEYYQRDANGGYTDMSLTDAGMDYLYNSEDVGVTLRVVGIARPNEDAAANMVSGAIGYTGALTSHAMAATLDTDIMREQLDDPATDVFTGLPFPTGDEVEPTDDEKAEAVTDYLSACTTEEKANAYLDVMAQPADEYVDTMVEQQMDGMTRENVEQMVIQQYAGEMGVDEDTVRSYIAKMDDDTLFSNVRDAVAQAVREQYGQAVRAQLAAQTLDQLAAAMDMTLEDSPYVQPFTAAQYVYLYDNYMPLTLSDSTYEQNLDRLGHVDLDSPDSISIYALTFADKDAIADRIEEYNDTVDEDSKITYTDYVALLMSSVTSIISGISYLLIAFVSISLVVSSIMIGIITYISVLERTKEIGILRAVGASKGDISRVFNAETLIVGLIAGLLGIGVTVLLIFPINAILLHYTGIPGLKAVMPMNAAGVLVALSVVLTLLGGLIPSRAAAKKDPVTALRTE